MHSPENMPLPLKVEEGTTSQCVQACLETGKKDSSLKPTQEYISADPFQTFDHQTKICMVLSQYMCGDLFANRKLIQQWSVSTFHSSLLWHLHLLPLVLLLGVVWKPAPSIRITWEPAKNAESVVTTDLRNQNLNPSKIHRQFVCTLKFCKQYLNGVNFRELSTLC